MSELLVRKLVSFQVNNDIFTKLSRKDQSAL